MTFNGAIEYKAYEGITAGYNGTMTEADAEEVFMNPLFPKMQMSVECAEIFYMGFLLGQEIRRDYEERKELRQAIKKLNQTQKEFQKVRRDTTGARDLTNGVSRSRFTVG